MTGTGTGTTCNYRTTELQEKTRKETKTKQEERKRSSVIIADSKADDQLRCSGSSLIVSSNVKKVPAFAANVRSMPGVRPL